MEGAPAEQRTGFGQGEPVWIGFALLFLIVLFIAITACCQKYLGALRRRWRSLKSQLRPALRVDIEALDAPGIESIILIHCDSEPSGRPY